MAAPAIPGVLLIGTDDGLRFLGDPDRAALAGRSIRALAARGSTTWAVADGIEILSSVDGGEWRTATSLESDEATCLLPPTMAFWSGPQERTCCA